MLEVNFVRRKPEFFKFEIFDFIIYDKYLIEEWDFRKSSIQKSFSMAFVTDRFESTLCTVLFFKAKLAQQGESILPNKCVVI